jgi:hypothetical protein
MDHVIFFLIFTTNFLFVQVKKPKAPKVEAPADGEAKPAEAAPAVEKKPKAAAKPKVRLISQMLEMIADFGRLYFFLFFNALIAF